MTHRAYPDTHPDEHPDAPATITNRQWKNLLELVVCMHNTMHGIVPEDEDETPDEG
jgi:hypothetical protein